MEAELFAAESKRPALDGRALLCAANYAREIQGITASHKRNDARNRAPVPPRFAAHLRCVSAKEGKGSQEGTGNHTWCPVPFCLCRQTAAIPPAGGNRQSSSASADNLSPPDGGNFPESFIKALPEQRPCAPATESASRSFAARFLLRVPVRRSTAPPCARW